MIDSVLAGLIFNMSRTLSIGNEGPRAAEFYVRPLSFDIYRVVSVALKVDLKTTEAFL